MSAVRRAFFSVLTVAAACQTAGQGGGGTEYRELPSDQIMIGVTVNSTSNGIRSATGTYDTVYVFNDSSSYHVKGVRSQLFNAAGEPTATITADSGVMNLATDALVARGNVVLITQTGCRIESEQLDYDPQLRRISSPVAARFLAGGRETTVTSFDADDEFVNVRATGMSGALPEGC